ALMFVLTGDVDEASAHLGERLHRRELAGDVHAPAAAAADQPAHHQPVGQKRAGVDPEPGETLAERALRLTAGSRREDRLDARLIGAGPDEVSWRPPAAQQRHGVEDQRLA